LNRTVTAPARLLFLAYVFSVDLSAPQIVFFVATVILLSFSAAGVPRGGTAFTTAPAYLAVGIPIEGLVLLEAIDSIPDIFMTVLNVTADLAAAVLVARIPAVRRAFATPAEPPDLAGAEVPQTMLQPSAM
jgi:Na+/H+-dicarboxylate symporter